MDVVELLLESPVAVVEVVDEPRVRRVAAVVRRAQLLQPARQLRVRCVGCESWRNMIRNMREFKELFISVTT